MGRRKRKKSIERLEKMKSIIIQILIDLIVAIISGLVVEAISRLF